jgi:hypothetical protein
LAAALATAAGLSAPTAAGTLDLTREALVMLGPESGLRVQIRYLTSTWPAQHVIAAVTTEAAARCGTGSADKVYCTQDVRLAEAILIRWLESDPRAPGERFAIHYWYDPARGAAEIGPGADLLVFLAPTHAQGTYTCTVLMRATDAVLRDVREASRMLEGR